MNEAEQKKYDPASPVLDGRGLANLVDRVVLNPRTIATVAAELQSAMDAAARVPKLRAELDGLLGRKPRGAKKGSP